MKNFIKILIIAIILVTIFTTCNKEREVERITLDRNFISLKVGEKTKLILSYFPENATNSKIDWYSTNDGIATVSGGNVVGVKKGKVAIVVKTANGKLTDTCFVNVDNYNDPFNNTHEMISVIGGTFTMGYTSEQGSDYYQDEIPAHQVTLYSYSIGRYEVTQAQWEVVMGNNPSYFKGADLPVVKVSWNAIVGTSGKYMVLNGTKYYENGFIYKLNQLTGKNYRLPTEAEWEFAARGGILSDTNKYSGSSNIDDVAWYNDNSEATIHNVGMKQANELGIFDMSGNAWEWCSDWFGDYIDSSQTNPTGAVSGTKRVLRGGCWNSEAMRCRLSIRGSFAPENNADNFGFRLVLEHYSY